MAVFRVERTSDYTVMSNYHLRDKRLSLKAKGLLSQMLSLPEDWDYTLAGLCCINRDSKDAIRTAIRELEEAGYIRRRQTRVWRCSNRLENGKKICKNSPTLKEPELQKALMRCIATLLDNKERVKKEVMQAEENILRYEGATQDPRQLLDRIQEIDQQTSNLLFLVARSEDTSIYEGKFKALKEEKQALQTELESLQRTSQMDAEAQNRIQKVWDCIQNAPTDFTQYDDDLVRRIVEQVIVYSQEKVVVKFVGGYSVEMVTGN